MVGWGGMEKSKASELGKVLGRVAYHLGGGGLRLLWPRLEKLL